MDKFLEKIGKQDKRIKKQMAKKAQKANAAMRKRTRKLLKS